MDEKLVNRAKKIKLAMFDVDGVMTDGKLYYNYDGEALKAFHVRDGYGIKQLINNNIVVAIVTARNSKIVSNRMKNLGVSLVFQGVNNKENTLYHLLEKLSITTDEVAYIGDDIIDVPVMQKVGLSFAVADAHAVTKTAADKVTRLPGGSGAAREFCDYLLLAKGINLLPSGKT